MIAESMFPEMLVEENKNRKVDNNKKDNEQAMMEDQ